MADNPWESVEGKVVWKTKSQYFTWLRGALRRLWSDYPLRKVWKKTSLRPVTAQERSDRVYHPSTKNVGQCVYCNQWMAGSKLECDHVIESDGCTDKDTAEKFLWHCGGQTGDNFVLACKPCHKIKSHSERKGISFEEAALEKQAIEWEKNGEDHQRFLLDKGYTKEETSNTKKRRKIYISYLNTIGERI